VVLLFSSRTGELLTIFQDEGYLTDMRTAAAGAVAAKYLAPAEIEYIGIIGTGLQAKLQLDYLREVTACRRVKIWGRNVDRARALTVTGFEIEVVDSPAEVAAAARLIVTTTASRGWLLGAADVQPGTHITAMGADGGGKQELDPRLFAFAKIRTVDSLSQCAKFGDSSFALEQGVIRIQDLVELGQMIQDPSLRRQGKNEISIADLTGVAVQDMAIAELALQGLQGN
jgi:ornithine cyclodeaminase